MRGRTAVRSCSAATRAKLGSSSAIARGKAYRRPATDNDMETLLTFYQQGRNQKTFDQGIESAIRRIISGWRSAIQPKMKNWDTAGSKRQNFFGKGI